MATQRSFKVSLDRHGRIKEKPCQIIDFLNLGDNSTYKDTIVGVDRPLFTATPSSVRFDQYKPFEEIKLNLFMRNADTVARRIRIEPPDSPYFAISTAQPVCKGQVLHEGKVAAGMKVCFTVTFRPQERREYSYDLVCVTEREKFVVPLFAPGPQAVFNFPESLNFGSCPVKLAAKKTFLVRNAGDKEAYFKVSTSSAAAGENCAFTAVPASGYCGVGASVQICVTFEGSAEGSHEGILTAEWDEMVAETKLEGFSTDIPVFLSDAICQVDPAYITLKSERKVTIQNNSDYPVSFNWRAVESLEEEQLERERLSEELQLMEQAELEELQRSPEEDTAVDDDLSEDDDDLPFVPPSKRLALASIWRKYRQLQQQLREDPLHFVNDMFTIEPIQGEIWAHSELTVTVTFCPLSAADYSATPCLDIAGREARLPLELRGTGIGPKASFTHDIIDVGDVFINTKYGYELAIQNQGDIPAEFSLASDPDDRFTFSPSSGKLGVGECKTIEVVFHSQMLGDFSEGFEFKLKGSPDCLVAHFKGHVIGPTFHFDVDEIDFGAVSYEFLNSRVFSLHNTSEVPMSFELRIPQDGKFLNKEFDIIPPSGTVLPKGQQRIQLDFISTTVQEYDFYLTVDVDGVGKGLLSLPVHAVCQVPEVTLKEEELLFDECFLRFPYSKLLTLVNKSDQQARYEVLEQDGHSAMVATFDTDSPRGVIAAHSELRLKVALVCEKRGRVKLPLHLRIAGSTMPPLLCLLHAQSVGPNVVIQEVEGSDGVDGMTLDQRPSLDWGQIPALEPVSRNVRIRNKSLIPAPFRTFMKNPRSKFDVDISDGVLTPNETLTLTLSATLDDTTAFSDQMHILVTEGEPLVMDLRASGSGSTIRADQDLSVIELGSLFTAQIHEKQFLLENKGRRSQLLTWENLTVKEREQDIRRGGGAAGKKREKKKPAAPADPIFVVVPQSVDLKPRTACVFTLRSLNQKVGEVTEVLECTTKIDKEKKVKSVFKTSVKADFIHPLLQPSLPVVAFTHTYMPGEPTQIQTKPLTLRNISALPLCFTLRSQPPFSVMKGEICLKPEESVTVDVVFDPGYKGDRVSHVASGKLSAIYKEHPRKDHFDLQGTIQFPNLKFESSTVDFGCILNDTAKSSLVKVTNCGEVDAAFQWSFLDEGENASATSTRRASMQAIPLNQVFDILPIRGVLKPGDSEEAEFTFYGHPNRRFEGRAVCDVEGGPDYQMRLCGDSNCITYKLDRQFLDFGHIPFDHAEEKVFQISNTGKVAFNFLVRTDMLSRAGIVEVSPASGRVAASATQRVIVRFRPGVPDCVSEMLLLEVAHFEPVEFPVVGYGVYSCATVSLPRTDQANWDAAIAEARTKLLEKSARGEASPRSPRAATAMTTGTRKSPRSQEPLQLDVEAEATRLEYMRYLLEAPPGDEAAPFIIAQYVADFGNVVAGNARKKTFKVTNVGVLPINFELDKKIASSKGFSVDPLKVMRLPESESVDFTVTFRALKTHSLGPVQVVIPLEVKNGPSVEILLRVNVTVPDIEISTESLEFKTILIGQCTTMTIQIHNTAPVPAEWCPKPGLVRGQRQQQDASAFIMQPYGSTLAPGERQNVEITFAPADVRAFLYKFPIRVTSNSKTKMLQCKGVGTEQRIRFDPPVANLGPILPFAAPVSKRVLLRNLSQVPVEVYSVDFDRQYKEEEAILLRATGWDQDNPNKTLVLGSAHDKTMLVPPRLPGEGLPDFLLAADALRAKKDRLNDLHHKLANPLPEDANEEQTQERAALEEEEKALAAELRPASAHKDGEEAGEVGELDQPELWASEESPRIQGRAVNIVVVAPPVAGGTTLARRIAGKFEYGLITLNDAVSWAIEAGTAAGKEASGVLGSELNRYTMAARKQEALEAEERLAASKTKKKGKGKVEEVEEKPPLVFLSEQQLAGIVMERVRRVECAAGVVIDSLSCLYAENISVVASALKLAFADQPFFVASVQFEQEELTERHATLQETLGKLIDQVPEEEETPIDSEELSNMSEEALEAHRSKEKLMAEIQDAKTVLKRLDSEELAPSIEQYFSDLKVAVSVFSDSVEPEEKLAEEEAVPVPEEKEEKLSEEAKEEEEQGDPEAKEGAAKPETVIALSGVEEPEVIFASATALLPDRPEDMELEPGIPPIPDPVTRQVLRRPGRRSERGVISQFSIVSESAEGENAVEEGQLAGEATEDGQEKKEEEKKKKITRWIVPANGELPIHISFSCESIGKFECSMGFEIVGVQHEFSLACRGLCAVPTIASDPRNVFMNRAKARREGALVNKKYVINRGTYEFGPLLAGKDPAALMSEPANEKTNAERFRLTNNGVYPASLTLGFRDAPEEGSESIPFAVVPTELELNPGQTETVAVWAYPPVPELFSNALVCTIQDNPDPVSFPLSCLGALPSCELHGPWEEKLEGGEEGAPATEEAVPLVDFDRLLLGRRESKTVKISNPSVIPVSWRLDLEEFEGIDEFSISPSSGSLRPGTSVNVQIMFHAIEEKQLDLTLKVVYSDSEKGLGPSKETPGPRETELPVHLKAEAYSVYPYAQFEEEAEGKKGVLDFGTARCEEESVGRTFVLENQGKYPINFNFSFRRRATQQVFTIEPREGTLAASEKSEITVTFRSLREVRLVDNKDIRCHIAEASTGEVVEDIVVTVSAQAVFTRCRVQPDRGLNFGAVKNDEERQRKLVIKNDGQFAFSFEILSKAAAMSKDVDTDHVLKFNESVGTDPLELEMFHIAQSGGVIEPGGMATIDAKFSAKGAVEYKNALYVQISGRDPREAGRGVLCSLFGESVIPGINTDDYSSIFEEQAVVREMDPSSAEKVFSTQERTFSFGHVVPSAQMSGVVEKFKLLNPFKINALVNLEVTPASSDDEGVFSAQPESLDIPSHEYRYIDVYFKPNAMRTYRAHFSATVTDGIDDKTNRLMFELQGEGTLPCIAVTSPKTVPGEGAVLNFGKGQIGRGKVLPVEIRNAGIVPAVVHVTLEHPPVPEGGEGEAQAARQVALTSGRSFSCVTAGTSITLLPNSSESIPVTFNPMFAVEDVLFSHLCLNVRQNQYDSVRIKLKGNAVKNVLTLENLPNDADEVLEFSDHQQLSGGGQEVAFGLKNHTDSLMRFVLEAHSDFSFTPSIGHIPPQTTKDITAVFLPESVPIVHEKVAVDLKFQSITLTGEEAGEWDNAMKVVKFVEDSEEGDQTRVEDIAPEPEYEAAEEPKEIPFFVSGTADSVGYECDTRSVLFRPTLMYQSRVFEFPVKNTSKTTLTYRWSLESLNPTAKPFTRPTTAATSMMVDIPCPFTLLNKDAPVVSGSIQPGEKEKFTVRFAPVEVDDYDYKAVCSISNLPEHAEPLEISLRGIAQRPIVHFDLPASDYPSRRPQSLAAVSKPLDLSTRVVEFESLGTRVRNTKRFYVINPTNTSHEFVWEADGLPNNSFRCVTQRGLLLAGKQQEMVFEFTPNTVEPQEAFLRFHIPQHNISQLFVLAGRVIEPRVTLDRTRINFRELLVGTASTQTVKLVNKEHIPFSFVFEKLSVDADSHATTPPLKIEPMSGIVPPNGHTAVEIAFTPQEEKPHNFNISCMIRNKPARLNLNIKGEGFALHDKLVLEDSRSGSHAVEAMPLAKDTTTFVDFGHVHMKQRAVKNIVLTNTGKFSYDFRWKMPRGADPNPMITVTPETGKVTRHGRVACRLEFSPFKEAVLEDYMLTCEVAGTHSYDLSVSGRGTRPSLQFSFDTHDFGPCFVPRPGGTVIPVTASLVLTNTEMEDDISVECLFAKKPYLDVRFDGKTLRSGESVDIPIVFTPRSTQPYREVIPFEINGVFSTNVCVTGEGTIMRIELLNPAQKEISFGALRVGQESRRTVRLVNRSKRPVPFKLLEKTDSDGGALSSKCISWFPAGKSVLPPRETLPVEITFCPPTRIPPFTESLLLSVGDEVLPLLTLEGGCQGIEVKLEMDTLNFGAVCANSRMTRPLQIENAGDVGVKYRWESSAFAPDFSVSPEEGFLAPHSDAKLSVTFHPSQVDPEVRYDNLRCDVEGAEPLFLSLAGSCVPQPEENIKELNFECKVRDVSKQTISLPRNTTKKSWHLTPAIDSSHWIGEDNIDIAPGESANYELQYAPVTMTTHESDGATEGGEGGVEKLHEGKLFIAMPDGSALLWLLHGRALPPIAAGTVNLSTPAKKNLIVPLKVVNWLSGAQRFAVKIECDDPSPSRVLRGPESFDVPPNGERVYKLSFYAYDVCNVKAKATFLNTATGEYLFYDVSLTATEAGILDEIRLEAPVRQVVRHILVIENPLPAEEEVTFEEMSCTDPNVRVQPMQALTGRPEGSFAVEYRPLVVYGGEKGGVKEAQLTLRSKQLGSYQYKLRLVATSTNPERPLFFTSTLGSSQTLTFRFRSFAMEKVEFAVRSSHGTVFMAPKSVVAEAAPDWSGVEVSMAITFEPDSVGEINDSVVLTSSVGGEYTCPVSGQCLPPRPKGPIIISASSAGSVDFKNVFAEAQVFSFVVDSPAFTVSPVETSLEPKKSVSISIKLNSDAEEGASGKLMIAPASPLNVIPWVFYLKGEKK